MYIHALGLRISCHNFGYGGDGFGSGVWLCVGGSVKEIFGMVGGGVRGCLIGNRWCVVLIVR